MAEIVPGKKKDQTPDWMSDKEYISHKRKVWNDLQAQIDHPSPLVRKAALIGSLAIILSLVIFICSFILLGAAEALKAIF